MTKRSISFAVLVGRQPFTGDLEEPIKQLLLKQAVMTSDRDPGPEPVQLEQNIKRFLEEYARADQHAPLK